MPKLKEMLGEFLSNDFSEIGEFKAMAVFNHPEGAGSDNDVLFMDVQVNGKMLPLDNVLTDVWDQYYKEIETKE